MASLFRTFEGGKLADKADRLEKIIPDMVDLDWADNLAEEIGRQSIEWSSVISGNTYKLINRYGSGSMSWRSVVDEHTLEAKRR